MLHKGCFFEAKNDEGQVPITWASTNTQWFRTEKQD